MRIEEAFEALGLSPLKCANCGKEEKRDLDEIWYIHGQLEPAHNPDGTIEYTPDLIALCSDCELKIISEKSNKNLEKFFAFI